MNNDIRILQIATAHWRDKSGKSNFSVMGLGSDGKVYRWLKSKGCWELFVSKWEGR